MASTFIQPVQIAALHPTDLDPRITAFVLMPATLPIPRTLQMCSVLGAYAVPSRLTESEKEDLHTEVWRVAVAHDARTL